MPDLSLGFKVLIQPLLYLAVLVWALHAVARGIRKEPVEIQGIEMTRRRLEPHTLRTAFIRLVIGALVVSAIVITPNGHRAVVWSAVGGIQEHERVEGVSFVLPLLQQPTMVDTRAQRLSTTNAEGAINGYVQNKELLQYQVKCTATWRVFPNRADELVREVGPMYPTVLIQQHLYDACREGVGHYTALQLASQIDDVQERIEGILEPVLNDHGLNLVSVAVEDVVPPTDFLKSIEGEEVAARNADEAENRIREAIAKATQVEETARGEANAINIRALAEQQRMQRLGMSPTEYIWFTRDNLVLPQIVGEGFDFILPGPGLAPAQTPTTTTTTVPATTTTQGG